jgi:hypothetical protein
MAAYERQVRAAERQAELQHWAAVNDQLVQLANVHREYFQPAQRPVAPPPDAVSYAAILKRHEDHQLQGISVLKRSERKAAKARAEQFAQAEAAQEEARRHALAADRQDELDAAWQSLMANSPEHVFRAIDAAYEDNEMPAAPLNVVGDRLMILVKIGAPEELIPERAVGFTPTGRPTHKKRTKKEVNLLYAEVLASHVLATVSEALAVAPAINEARVLVIRGDRLGGGTALVPLYAGRFDRARIASTSMDQINPLTVIEDADGLIHYKGQAQALAPLDLRDEPELRDVIEQIAQQLGWKLPDAVR